MKDIAVYGAGGLGREVACLIRRINSEVSPQWNFVGFFDDFVPAGTKNTYGTVLGNMDTLNHWSKPLAVVIGIGDSRNVFTIQQKFNNPLLEFPNIISPDAIFLDKDNVVMGHGNIICAKVLVSCDVRIGNFNLLNNYSIIGHDTVIGNCNSIMPSVKISGAVTIGSRNLLGVNSVVLQCKTIGDDTIIGASCVVNKDTCSGCTYIGVPAKLLKKQ